MKVVIQRVQSAFVEVDGQLVSQIGHGLVVLLGVSKADTGEEVEWLAEKTCNLRMFTDNEDKMNHSVLDIQGEILLVSQFTLYGDCKRGRRPDFTHAALGIKAEKFYERFIEKLLEYGLPIKTGIFGRHMKVALVNDGPVTLVIERNHFI